MENKDATHLFFIDADIEFNPEDVLRMVAYDRPVVVGAYPKKALNWTSIINAARADESETEETIEGHSSNYVVNFDFVQDEKGMNSNYLPLRLLTPAGFEWHTWEKAFKGKTPKPPPSLQDNLLERVNWLLQLDNSTRYIRSVGTNYAEDAMSGVLRYPSVMMGHDLKLFNQKDLRRMAALTLVWIQFL